MQPAWLKTALQNGRSLTIGYALLACLLLDYHLDSHPHSQRSPSGCRKLAVRQQERRLNHRVESGRSAEQGISLFADCQIGARRRHTRFQLSVAIVSRRFQTQSHQRHTLAAEERIAEIARELIASIAAPYLDLKGHEVQTNTSVGIALYPRDGQSVDELLTSADAAMYNAKKAGAGSYRFYDASLNASAARGLGLVARFRQVLKNVSFVCTTSLRSRCRTSTSSVWKR